HPGQEGRTGEEGCQEGDEEGRGEEVAGEEGNEEGGRAQARLIARGEPARVRPQAPLRRNPGTRRRRAAGQARAAPDLRHPAAPCAGTPLRLPPGDGRQPQELGGAKGTFVASGRETPGGRGGGPSHRLRQLRRRYSQGEL